MSRAFFLFCLLVGLSGCGTKTPIQPVNRDPIVHSLIGFPLTLSPGDSAVVVCHATDPDGDTMMFEWSSDCRLIKRGVPRDLDWYTFSNTLVVYAGDCAHAPADTGWVRCYVRDRRGGETNAGVIRIVIRR